MKRIPVCEHRVHEIKFLEIDITQRGFCDEVSNLFRSVVEEGSSVIVQGIFFKDGSGKGFGVPFTNPGKEYTKAEEVITQVSRFIGKTVEDWKRGDFDPIRGFLDNNSINLTYPFYKRL